ncbi:MAG: lipoyl(octanoyl) transferase LipB [Conexivisphaerales archaeon]
MKVEVFDLGMIDYGKALEMQRGLVKSLTMNENIDREILLLLEHPHVITLGRSTTTQNFREQPIPVYQVERGGDATYHGPGQLVGYPIFHLRDHDVKRLVNGIEEVLIRSVKHFGIVAERKEGHRGVWVSINGNKKKLASIGIAVSNWVTYHGFALNVNTDLSYFGLINPCGLPSEMLTSMERILGKKTDMQEVKKRVIEEFGTVFDAEIEISRAEPAFLAFERLKINVDE